MPEQDGSLVLLVVFGSHFHDLRHTRIAWPPRRRGATLRDRMVRMGHGSMRAALIYQHASRDAGRHLSDSLSERPREGCSDLER